MAVPKAYIKTQEQKSEQNKHLNKSLLTPFFEFIESEGVSIDEFDEAQIIDYLGGEYRNYVSSNRELSKSTLSQIYQAILRFVKWQERKANEMDEWFKARQRLRRIDEDVKPPEVEGKTSGDYLKLSELSKLFEVSKDPLRTIYVLLGYFGFRKGELFEKENRVYIKFRENKFRVKTSKWVRGKPKERELFFNDKIAGYLKRAKDSGWLDLKESWLYYKNRDYRDITDRFDFSFHNLRHTFNHFMRQRLDEFVLKVLMGHKTDKNMSYYYDGVEPETIEEAMIEKHYYNELNY